MRTITGIFLLLIAAPASACVVAVPNLSYQQWLAYCGPEIIRMCGPASQAIPDCPQRAGQAGYQDYQRSQAFLYRQGCPQGARQCINGWISWCNGTQWMTTSSRCGR